MYDAILLLHTHNDRYLIFFFSILIDFTNRKFIKYIILLSRTFSIRPLHKSVRNIDTITSFYDCNRYIVRTMYKKEKKNVDDLLSRYIK